MRTSILLVGAALALTAIACTTEDSGNGGWRRGATRAITTGANDDVCAPENTPHAEDNPFAPCALKTEHHVVDLTLPQNQKGTGFSTRSLKMQADPAAPAAAAAGLCQGQSGPGFTTCGPNGNDSCCRAATVPPGKAGALVSIGTSYDLGVYTVTAARFRQFVDAFGGNLRGAATDGKLPGYKTANADKLPASRAAVDDELGPSCKFRGDPGNYGARTWWSQDVQDTVASIMSDDNDRAADIRNDARKQSLDAKPANCVSYYMAAAFCAWDGGRLPTNDEWVYAALGGEELREYPWGTGRTRDRLVTDMVRAQQAGDDGADLTWPEDFPFFDNGMNAYHIAPPGRKPAGMGRWGHLDLAGNVLQWTADIDANGGGTVRGGSWEGHSDANAAAYTNYDLMRTYGSLGFRCAYGAAQPVVPPEPPKPAIQKITVYRGYAAGIGDHLQGITPNEGAPTYASEGVSFQTVGGALDAATQAPLFRCLWTANGHHFLSNDPACEGAGTSDGPVGNVYKAQVEGTLPIYRCLGGGVDHLSTLFPQECVAGGFTVEGSQGFAFPAQ